MLSIFIIIIHVYTMFRFVALISIIIVAILYMYFKKTILTYQDDHLLLVHPFYNNHHFQEIVKYCLTLDDLLENDTRVTSRKTYMCDSKTNSQLYRMVFSPYFFKQVRKILKIGKCVPSEFPIEYRKYETGSEGMPWHQDQPLFKQTYYECVLTITNTSDSMFEFMIDDNIHSVDPKPNSLALVKPSSVYHKITPITSGERRILKFVFLLNENNEKSEHYDYESKL